MFTLLFVLFISVYSLDIGVPAYFYPRYPDPVWEQMQGNVPTCEFAIANVDSGPGTAVVANYKNQITAARSAGLKILGYVHTSYGNRSETDVKKDVSDWAAFYKPLDGIFYDEASNKCPTVDYYMAIGAYAKNQVGGIVIINPGTVVPECMNATADMIVTFEGAESSYPNWKPSGWEAKYPANKFYHIVHTASAASLPGVVSLAKSRNVGNVYVTDKSYSALPSYWTQEVTAVKQQ